MRNVSGAVGSMLLSLAFGAACGGESSPPESETVPIEEEAVGESDAALCASDGCARGREGAPFMTALRIGEGRERAEITAMAASPDGGVWVAGHFDGSLDIDGERIVAAGGRDGFVAHLGGCGNLTWARALGGTGDDEVLDLAVDGRGRGYLLLPFTGTIDLGGAPIVGTGIGRDALVLSLDDGGRTRWSETVRSVEGGAFPTSLTLDAIGDVVLLGSLEGETWFGDVRLRSGVVRGFLAWIDGAGGRTRRAAVIPTASDWEPLDAEPSSLGGVYVAGHDARGVGVFAMHVAATGDVIWSRSFRGSRQFDEVFHDLAVDDDGMPVLAVQGYLGEAADLGDPPPNLVVKLDDRGAPTWMVESVDSVRLVDDGPAGQLVAVARRCLRGPGGVEARCSGTTLTALDDDGFELKQRRLLRGAITTALATDDLGTTLIAGTAADSFLPRPIANCSTALEPGDLFVARPDARINRVRPIQPDRPRFLARPVR